MLRKDKKTGMLWLCENIGKICIAAACAYSAFVLIATALEKKDDDDYQDRLRKAYAGLSPEEY